MKALNARDVLRVSEVKRWHIVETLRPQTLADHSYRVAMLALRLAEKAYVIADLDPTLVGMILYAAAVHDVHEIDYGDIPTPAKTGGDDGMEEFWKSRGGMPTIPENVQLLIKIADKMEALLFYAQFGLTTIARGEDVRGFLIRQLATAAQNAQKTSSINWPKLTDEMVAEAGFVIKSGGKRG